MSIIAKINGIPLFTSKWEAERWGKRLGLTGTHTHVWQESQVCWMAGKTHVEINNVFKPRKRVIQTVNIETGATYVPVTQTTAQGREAAPPPAWTPGREGGSTAGGGGY